MFPIPDRRPAAAWLVLAALLAGAGGLAGAQDAERGDDEPSRTDLVEKTESRLAQISITVNGPSEIAANLTVDDFTLKVNLKRFQEFKLDRFCERPDASEPVDSRAASGGSLPVSYTFYFDQPHLTLSGRQRALDLSRQLVEKLIRDGNRGMVVSNAGRLSVIEPFTEDPGRLIDAIERLEHDRDQWDFYATEEEGRVARVVEIMNDEHDVSRAIAVARSYQREERWRTDKNMRRLSLVLGQMAEVPPPKAVIYFADSLRSSAGEHYLSFFGDSLRRTNVALSNMVADSTMATLPFDRLVNEASAHGVRLYTVQAEGVVSHFERALPFPGFSPSSPSPSRERHRNAQDTLADMATETGGQAFLNGVGGRKIAERILGDTSCLYVASFDPTGLPQDAPLRVVLKLRREGLTARTAGRTVVQSDATRLRSRLLSAFSLDASTEAGLELQTNLVQTGFREGSYSALLQISAPGTALAPATWDLGASVVSQNKVREEVSGRISSTQAGRPIILEREIRLKPGDYEVVAVAHETTSGFVLSDRIVVEWTHPDRGPVTAGPIALLQPTSGAFLRGETTRTSGSLVRSESESLRIDLPAALTTLICRSRRSKGTLRVERSLAGEVEIGFPPLQIEPDENRCAQVRDLISPGSLRPGYYHYELRVLDEESRIVKRSREILAAGG